MDVEKIKNLGISLGLEGVDLKEFIQQQVSDFKEIANFEREERQRERDEKQRQRDFELERMKLEEGEKEKIRQFQLEQTRLDNQKELEMIKLKAQELAVKNEVGENNLDSSHVSSSHMSTKPKIKMPYFEDTKDDMDAYLRRFERVMQTQECAEADWSTHLAVLLRGKALEVYVRLSPEEAKNYSQVKTALLKRYDLTEDGFRRKFRTCRIEHGETFTQFLQRLKNYLTRWIQLSDTPQTFEGLQDLLLKEQILNVANRDLALFLKERLPRTATDMATLAEQYQEARHGWFLSTGPKKFGKDGPGEKPGPSGKDASGPYRTGNFGKDTQARAPVNFIPLINRECYRCHRKGHLARDCKAKEVASCESQEDKPCSVKPMKFIAASFRGEDVRVLRDTGCSSACIRRSLLPESTVLDHEGMYKGIDNVERYAPMGKIFVKTPYFTGETEVMVFDNPLYDLIIGDLPGARERNDPDPEWTQLEIQEVAAVETRAQWKEKQRPTKPLKTPLVDCENVDAEVMKLEQQKDPSLSHLHNLATQSVSRTIRNNVSAFVYKSELLMREFTSPRVENGKTFTQLVVPQKFRVQVMRVGHETLMAGHLGTKKTIDRIQRQFYWPGIQSEVRRFCRSCDVCQRTVHKGKVQKVPLGKMPLIDVPFDRVAVDLIGPLDPVTDRKNRYILTLVDYATRYPEAVPLQNIDTETVAEALVSMFSRVGVPREILSDMGTQFTSELMKEVGRLLSMKQLVTTPYHPSCNGLVERFNGTLKSMLKKMCVERPKDWDRYVMPLLFAYREVPQESLGFSPFELLYGRTVRGPMHILRELWTKEIPDPEVRSTYQYIIDLKERLQDTFQLAQNELKKASSRYRTYYNRKAKNRKFAVGEKVLLLLPTQSNKLLMQWKGPFEVVATQGVADYRIQMGDKVKTFHANLLRKYYDRKIPTENREACAAVIESAEDCVDIHTETYMEPPSLQKTETFTDVNIAPTLSSEQSDDIKNLLQEHPEVMTDLPGRTNLEEISIKLTTTEPVRSKVYSVPYHLRDTVKKELDQMLDMGVIEPSKSAYASPIVLIRKKDNTYRFCTDFRDMNKVSIFDPEPIPDAEGIFSRLSHSKYYTKIDLSKGYWQVPVVEECREMTAFVTPHGLFQWRVMPFGLINAPAVFSRMMRKLLQGLPGVDNYIDDIIIFSETWDDHMKSVRLVLEKLQKAGLTAKPSKCFFGFSTLEFLGHMVGGGELLPEPSKVSRIMNASKPQNKKQLRSFLGLIGYYRKFIPNFSAIAAPLTDMTKKGMPNHLEWSPAQEQSLETMKKMMESAPILRLPDLDRPFTVRTDASDKGLGAVLLQEYDGEKFPVMYLSRKLNQSEKNYATIEKEGLAIVWAIDKLKQYLYGKEFLLETDHKPLTWLHQAKITNSRIMRWALSLQPFRFVIHSIAGSDNVGADFMSRCGGA